MPLDGNAPSFELLPLDFQPGIFADLTPYAAGRKYVYSDKVRFRYSFPETIGGASKYNSLITFDGVPRAVKTWTRLDSTQVTAVGTHSTVELEIAGTKYDITPFAYVASGTLAANPFGTGIGLLTVTVHHVAHGRATGDIVDYVNAPTLDGIDLGALAWPITAVAGVDDYTITTTTAATGTTAAGGGAGVTYRYNSVILGNNPFTTTLASTTVAVHHVAHGRAIGDTVVFSGATSVNSVDPNGTQVVTAVAGVDDFSFAQAIAATGTGAGGGAAVRAFYGVTIGAASGVNMRLPCLAPWGEDLLFTMGRDSGVYRWIATDPTKRARRVPRAPTAHFICVSPDDLSLIAFGVDGDDMDLAWSNQQDYTNWTASSTTTADQRHLLRGSIFTAALALPGGILVFTDTAVHMMTFIGGDFVFAINFIGKTSICGQNAVNEFEGIAYWMGNNNFYIYDGRLRTMPCSCKRYVFKNKSATQLRGALCGINEEFNEAWFFYPTSSATYNDAYICYNYAENLWYIGTWQRTAWLDPDLFSTPLALDATGVMYRHETGTQDDLNPLGAILRSGDFEIAPSRTQMMMCQRLVVDAEMTGNYYLSAKFRNAKSDAYYYAGPVLVTVTTEEIWITGRGRRMALEWATPTLALEELATEASLLDFITTEDGDTLLADGVPKDQTLNLATTWRLGVQEADLIADGYG